MGAGGYADEWGYPMMVHPYLFHVFIYYYLDVYIINIIMNHLLNCIVGSFSLVFIVVICSILWVFC